MQNKKNENTNIKFDHKLRTLQKPVLLCLLWKSYMIHNLFKR